MWIPSASAITATLQPCKRSHDTFKICEQGEARDCSVDEADGEWARADLNKETFRLVAARLFLVQVSMAAYHRAGASRYFVACTSGNLGNCVWSKRCVRPQPGGSLRSRSSGATDWPGGQLAVGKSRHSTTKLDPTRIGTPQKGPLPLRSDGFHVEVNA